MLKKILYILLIIPVILTSCENDLEVIGDWKETAIVYGLLNPGESVNYVRVEKAFLGEGNALVMAQHSDSIYYGDNLSVVLERRKNGQLLSTIVMGRDSTIPKNPGTFANDKHVVYKTSQKIFTDSDYSLIIHNEQSGYTATAHTAIIDSIIQLSSPVFNVNWASSAPVNVSWASGKDARVYELLIRFIYAERTINGLQADTSFLDWRYGQVKAKNLNGGENLTVSIPGIEFYNFVATHLEVPTHLDTVRVAVRMEFVITSGGDELSTYLDVISASPGASQTIPNYTNINNGFGIFSSRNSEIFTRNLHGNAVIELACGSLTKHLRFVEPDNTLCP